MCGIMPDPPQRGWFEAAHAIWACLEALEHLQPLHSFVHPTRLPPRLQVHSSAQTLKLITFDADGTLYADGAHIEHDNEMIRHIISLMRRWAGPGHPLAVHVLPPAPAAALQARKAPSIRCTGADREVCLPAGPGHSARPARCMAFERLMCTCNPTSQQHPRGDCHGSGLPGSARAV